ncbi:MAG: hypothetical protein NVV74_24165 [Magnetospirillum sp.]|nr:hypothetical protein [Magnetospirillum sp.]
MNIDILASSEDQKPAWWRKRTQSMPPLHDIEYSLYVPRWPMEAKSWTVKSAPPDFSLLPISLGHTVASHSALGGFC